MSATTSPPMYLQFFNAIGVPLVGGLLFTYRAATSTKQATWTDSTQGVQNSNPIILDSTGSAFVWGDPTLLYKFITAPANDTDPPSSPIRSIDNIEFPVTNRVLSALITQSFIGAALYPQTAAEVSAGVTPVNYAIPSHAAIGDAIVDRYGTNTTPGTTDMTAAAANCLLVSGVSGAPTRFLGTTYALSADLLPAVGVQFLQGGSGPFAVDIKGSGREQTILKFTAGTNGVYFNGVSGFKLCGQISDLTIDGTTVLPTALTFANCDMPRAERLIVRRCTGRGVFFNTTIMGRFDNCYVVACGSAGQAQVEILSSTTFEWHQSYCSSGNAAAVAAVRVDKSANTNFFGGAVETPGTIQIGALADTTVGCVAGVIFGMDFEKPTDHFLEFGYGMSGAAFVQGWQVRGCSGYPAGAASVPYAVKLNACTSIRFGDNNWSQNGSPTAAYWLEGVTNNGVVIEAHPELYGSAWPWVMQNGAQIKWATPLVDFTQKDTIGQGNYPTVGTISGATASIQVHATQGGIYRDLIMGNGGATTMTALTGGIRGMRIMMISTNGNTTLTHSTVTADQWNLTLSGAANLLMVANKPYTFVHNGTNWYQVTN